MGKTKYFVGAIVMALSIFLFFVLKNVFNTDCSGWKVISPICWIGSSLDFLATVAAIIILIFGIMLGGMIMLLNKENWIWIGSAIVLLILAIVMMIVTPGFPDEFILGGISLLLTGIGATQKEGGKKIEFNF